MKTRDMKYESKPILPESPSISGSFNSRKKINKRTPIIIKNAPAITLPTVQDFKLYYAYSQTLS